MTKKLLSRRDFLKLTSLLSLSYALPQYWAHSQAQTPRQNVLIVVFDAFSASNISLYGYPRPTTPNLARLAERAMVYHNHLAGGNFTTPGTASLLTGTLPWTHRAFFLFDPVAQAMREKNIFRVFDAYHRFAYTHNRAAEVFLKQFLASPDTLTPWKALYLEKSDFVYKWFNHDFDTADVSFDRAFQKGEEEVAYSLFLSNFASYFKKDFEAFKETFPLGLPGGIGDEFLLEEGIDALQAQLLNTPQPFLGYYHFFPPHDPYHTRQDFFGRFHDDAYQPPHKPPHYFKLDYSPETLARQRLAYDETILYVDAEFARLYTFMEEHGLLENTWLVLTSDHGEMFERSINNHRQPVLYQPVIHIPLLIFPPGQKTRVDIHTRTSAVDLLPTLAHLTQHPVPPWAEGRILPPFSPSSTDPQPDLFSLKVRELDANQRITMGTATIVRNPHKLIYYFGDQDLSATGEMLELYNLESDPEELHNLFPSEAHLASELLDALKRKLAQG
jgi:arylsulfatase A-like enzyme